jgi:hypothetical protein
MTEQAKPGAPVPGDRKLWLGAALVSALVLVVLFAVAIRCAGPERRPANTGQTGPAVATVPPEPPAAAPQPTGPVPAASPPPAADGGAPPGGDVTCPPATVDVVDAEGLETALRDAEPGDSIHLADGTYTGKFVARNPGLPDRPVFLCGSSGAVLDGGSVKGGYALHLDGASHWRLVGFTVRNGQKGVMGDGVQRVVIQGLTVEQIGDEAIHLRKFSSDNVVQGNSVRNTGLRRDKFGEGIYIGTAQSNWCTITDCKPDNSDRNVVRDNVITGTTAEPVDVKEGTTGGRIVGNTFDGAKLSGSHADSWVDVKGNKWVIEDNVGRNALEDGFQTHSVVDGWGTDNLFRRNTAEVNGPGYGFHFAPALANKLTCDNKVTGAGKGVSNVPCG